MSRAEILAKVKRDISQLRARLGRVDNETFLARQELDELERQVGELAAEGPVTP